MMRALYSAIGGLRNHMTYMDVVANNIANVNTAGFKSARVTFQDMLSLTLNGASYATDSRGGTNPQQIGLGVTLGGVDVIHTQGAMQATNKSTDFAIQGLGMFILRDGSRQFYTRDGAFDVSTQGELVSPVTGYKVMGWNVDPATGLIDTTQPITPLTIPFGRLIAAQPSTTARVAGNLDSATATAGTLTSTLEVYDSLGKAHPINLTFTKDAAANSWTVSGASSSSDVSTVVIAPATVTFNSTGAITAPAPPAPLVVTTTFNAGVSQASPVTTNVDVSQVTQFASAGTLTTTFNNGYAAGALTSFSVGANGDITGVFSNGSNRLIAQIALASFTNPGGLEKVQANMYQESANSGPPVVGNAASGGRGQVASGMLESSNTDLAREFTNVVVAQRGFQASSRIISTADEMLQDLVNLKR
ncbi:MAG: flagellar hook protein FlgE [Dehalococcoidia bacterium]|nr:flagellar hook protein FlgE [Dehalococcoidia bacterium]